MSPIRHPGDSPDLGEPRRDLARRGQGASPRGPAFRRDDAQRADHAAPCNGFTLVELMVVLVIIGLLATVVIINVMPATEK